MDVLLRSLTWAANRTSPGRVLAVGASIGRAWDRFHLPRRRRVRTQLRMAFPDLEPSQLETLSRRVFEHFGRSLAELILLRTRHRSELLDRVEIEGYEHVEAAEAESPSGAVLVVSAHYGNWELAGIRIARDGVPMAAVYRGLGSPVLDQALLDLRTGAADSASNTVDFTQLKMGRAGLGLARAFEAGRKVLVLMDQNARREEGVFVPFFGRPAAVRTGPLRMAASRGVPVLVAFIVRHETGDRHTIQIAPRLALESGGDEATETRNLARVTRALEEQIRERPDLWIWAHRRWHTAPLETDRVE